MPRGLRMILDFPLRMIWPGRRDEAGTPSRVCVQMGLAAGFAAFAGRCEALQPVLDAACRVAADGLGAGFAMLLVQHHHDGERWFVLQAGVGWRQGRVGHERLDADSGTAAGFAWRSGQPVLGNDIAGEGRFRVPPILAEHGVGCAVDVAIPGVSGDAAFGVLEVGGAGRGDFRPGDASFLQLLAHGVAAAAGRLAAEARHEAEAARGALDHRSALQEVHHRVRNDLQGVCAALDGEARRVGDEAQRQGLGRVGGRILALAGLYDHLLGQGVGGEVEFGSYLRALCGRISEAGGLDARSIDLHVEAEPVAVSRGRALSLAVAVNELVANAAKHAFVGGTFGRITVMLQATGSGGLVLGVADSGRGFAGPRPGGAGLGFVERLVAQAGGTIVREEGDGTRWRVTLDAER